MKGKEHTHRSDKTKLFNSNQKFSIKAEKQLQQLSKPMENTNDEKQFRDFDDRINRKHREIF